jgi:hypothetical protein
MNRKIVAKIDGIWSRNGQNKYDLCQQYKSGSMTQRMQGLGSCVGRYGGEMTGDQMENFPPSGFCLSVARGEVDDQVIIFL